MYPISTEEILTITRSSATEEEAIKRLMASSLSQNEAERVVEIVNAAHARAMFFSAGMKKFQIHADYDDDRIFVKTLNEVVEKLPPEIGAKILANWRQSEPPKQCS